MNNNLLASSEKFSENVSLMIYAHSLTVWRMASILALNHVTKHFLAGDKPLEVLRGISYTFSQKSTYALSGPSGTGKSTLLHILGGLEQPTEGTVLLDERPLPELAYNHSLLDKIGFVFQFHYLIHELTILENVMLPGLIKRVPSVQLRERALELLAAVGIVQKADAHPEHLSGGQLQRAALARALLNKPIFLIADEPTGNLDEDNAVAIVKLLSEFHEQWGMGIILCSHDKTVCQKMDVTLHLDHGKLTVM